MINSPVFLTFRSDKGDNFKIPYGSGFRVMYISPQLPPEDREKALGLTPSILGMDILCKFKVYVDKKKVVLTLD
jgi:hypothetical protein